MGRNSQITLFVILGIVFLFVIAFVYISASRYSLGQEIKTQADFDVAVSSLGSFMESCIEGKGKSALIQFGKQGGNAHLPDNYFTNGSVETSYLYYQGDVLLKNLSDWESEISSGVSEQVISCLEIEEIKRYDIESAYPSTKTAIASGNVAIDISWPITLRSGQFSHTFGMFSAKYPVNLIEAYNDVSSIISMEVYSPSFIDIAYLLELQTNVSFWAKNDTIIYSLSNNRSMIGGTPYKFTFASKMNYTVGIK